MLIVGEMRKERFNLQRSEITGVTQIVEDAEPPDPHAIGLRRSGAVAAGADRLLDAIQEARRFCRDRGAAAVHPLVPSHASCQRRATTVPAEPGPPHTGAAVAPRRTDQPRDAGRLSSGPCRMEIVKRGRRSGPRLRKRFRPLETRIGVPPASSRRELPLGRRRQDDLAG